MITAVWQILLAASLAILPGAEDGGLYRTAGEIASLISALDRGIELQVVEYHGGVGNAIAAYLQTKGLIDQAKILSSMKDTLQWIAALGWLFAISLAIGSVAVFGSYRQGAYLLVGPPLFYYMTTVTASTNGTELRVGNRIVPGAQAEQTQFLRYIKAIGNGIDGETGTPTGGGSVNVSFFFGVFDTIVTEMVQAVVGVLVNAEAKDDLRFVARERALNYVLHATPGHSGFTKLVGYAYYGECASVNNDAQRLYVNRIQPWVSHRPEGDLGGSQERSARRANHPDIDLDPEVKSMLISMKNSGAADFQDVPWTDSETHDKPVSCKQIWKWLGGACKHLAKQKLSWESLKAAAMGDTSGIPEDKTIEDVKKILEGKRTEFLGALAQDLRLGGTGTSSNPEAVLGAYILKNALRHTTPEALGSQAFSRSPFNSQEYELVFGPLANAEAHGGFMKLKYFAHSIPYIQGLLLYLLSIAFPFFAVFLVLPGRAPSFLVWCSLWAWVKSWDVGFAAVHVVRDIMWQWLGERVNMNQDNIDWADPVSILQAIYFNDPYMSMNAYWEIVCLLTCMVPLLTAHFCLGATGLFDMFKNSIDNTADRFRVSETKRSRRFYGNIIEHLKRENEHLVPETAMLAFNRQVAWGEQKATTITGRPVLNFGGQKAWHSQQVYDGARVMTMVGTPDMLQDTTLGVAGAKTQEAAGRHELDTAAANLHETSSGQVGYGQAAAKSEDYRVPHPFRGGAESLLGTSVQMDELARMYGSAENAYRAFGMQKSAADIARMTEEEKAAHAQGKSYQGSGITWDQVFARETQWQQEMQAGLSAVTTRRMDKWTRAIGEGFHRTVSQGILLDMGSRSPADAAKINYLPGMQELRGMGIMRQFFGDDRTESPGLDGDFPSLPK